MIGKGTGIICFVIGMAAIYVPFFIGIYRWCRNVERDPRYLFARRLELAEKNRGQQMDSDYPRPCRRMPRFY